jgi:hypothetical protein
MRARAAHGVGQHQRHAGELHVEQLELLPLSPTLACDAHHAVRSAPMLALITTSTSSPARLKTRVGGSTSPRALRVGNIPRQPRGPHRETTTRARCFAVGPRKYLAPEPMLQDPAWVRDELREGFMVPAYAYARNNPLANVDVDGLRTTLRPPVSILPPRSGGTVPPGAGLTPGTTWPPRRTFDPSLPAPTPYFPPGLGVIEIPVCMPMGFPARRKCGGNADRIIRSGADCWNALLEFCACMYPDQPASTAEGVDKSCREQLMHAKKSGDLGRAGGCVDKEGSPLRVPGLN